MKARLEERHILSLGSAILIVITVISGVAVFAIMQRQSKRVLGQGLSLALESRAQTFVETIRDGIHGAFIIATRADLMRNLERANQNPGDAQAVSDVRQQLRSFLHTGYSALAVYNNKGKRVAGVGDFVTDPGLTLLVPAYSNVTLLWKHGAVLRMRLEVVDEGGDIGDLVAEQRLPELDHTLFDVTSLGRTGELVVCGPSGNQLSCLPSRLHPEPMRKLNRRIHGHRLPMAFALAGKAGLLTADDYRGHRVVAAYTPLYGTGLAMVLKLDAPELYAPVWRRLMYVLAVLAILVLIGVVLLHRSVMPLVRNVVESEEEARRSHARSRDSEARLRNIFENVADGIVVVDSDGRVEAFNPGAVRIFGYTAADIIGRNAEVLIQASNQRQYRDLIQSHLSQGASPNIEGGWELMGTRQNGEVFPLALRITKSRISERTVFIVTIRDITVRKENEARILHLANHDPLTDLPNRNLFFERANQDFALAKRNGWKVGLMFIDLDGFKQVNDTYGHDVGDWLLIEVARRIRSLLREEDTLGRQGGDEFIVALPRIDSGGDAQLVAQRILDVIRRPFRWDGQEIRVGASIGMSFYPDDGNNVEAVLKCADKVMYLAKSGAGSGFLLHSRP